MTKDDEELKPKKGEKPEESREAAAVKAAGAAKVEAKNEKAADLLVGAGEASEAAPNGIEELKKEVVALEAELKKLEADKEKIVSQNRGLTDNIRIVERRRESISEDEYRLGRNRPPRKSTPTDEERDRYRAYERQLAGLRSEQARANSDIRHYEGELTARLGDIPNQIDKVKAQIKELQDRIKKLQDSESEEKAGAQLPGLTARYEEASNLRQRKLSEYEGPYADLKDAAHESFVRKRDALRSKISGKELTNREKVGLLLEEIARLERELR